VLRFLTLLLFTLLLIGVGFAVVNSKKFDETTRQLTQAVWAQASPAPFETYQPEQLAALPPPVKRYLEKALEPGMALNRRIRLQQHGLFNIDQEKGQWQPLQAVSHITTSPPGFLWDARISLVPPLRIRVVDYYREGQGGLSGKLLGTLPVVAAPPAPELDQGELLTWLAEAVWYPMALLPGNGISWTPLDERSARATVDDGHHRVSLDFHFNQRDEVSRIHSEGRARLVDGRYEMTPWSGRFRDYGRISGMLIPREGEVLWHLPGGDLPYMRARIDNLELLP
jgi:hypothetical protein